MNVLGISTSPRRNGNSDVLLQKALQGALSRGAAVEYVRLGDLRISPCNECDHCYTTGVCPIADDYPSIMSKILEADRLVFATPVFFMSVSAQAKILIDRCQCLWARKHVLRCPPIAPGRDRRAMVIAVGGTRSRRMFEPIRLTMRYYLNVLEMEYVFNLFVNNVDAAGDVEKHPAAMDDAFRLGALLAALDTPLPVKTIDAEIFS